MLQGQNAFISHDWFTIPRNAFVPATGIIYKIQSVVLFEQSADSLIFNIHLTYQSISGQQRAIRHVCVSAVWIITS